jgi:hypothetical protein
MPLSMLGTFSKTFNFVPTEEPQTWENPGPSTKIIIYCKPSVYLAMAPTVTDQDFLFDDTEIYVRATIDSGAPLSFMLAEESASGDSPILKITIAGDNW